MTDILTKEQIKEISALQDKMKKVLKESRFRHTVSVAHTAAALAMVHDASLFKALVAGMLHDCAKCYSDEELLSKCQKNGLPVSSVEEQNPSLLHAAYGAYLAQKKYAVTDPEILSAIKWHTTGKPEMTLLDKIVFTADYIEPYRNHSEKLPYIRGLAFQDINRAMVVMLAETLDYLVKKGVPIDAMTKNTYHYYQSIS